MYASQTDRPAELHSHILEDMVRACALTFGAKWEESLLEAEFVYNNGHDTDLKTSSLEALLTQDYAAPWRWAQFQDSGIFGTDMTPLTRKQVQEIREHLQVTQQRQR